MPIVEEGRPTPRLAGFLWTLPAILIAALVVVGMRAHRQESREAAVARAHSVAGTTPAGGNAVDVEPFARTLRRVKLLGMVLAFPVGLPEVGIGRPGEPIPQAGAARDYASDVAWRGRVEELARSASLIVVILGPTEGLGWELRTLEAAGFLSKVALVFPPVGDEEVSARLAALAPSLGSGDAAWFSEAARVTGALVAVTRDHQVTILHGERRGRLEYEVAVDLGARAITGAASGMPRR